MLIHARWQQPVQPLAHAVAACGRGEDHFDGGIDAPGVLDALRHVETDMGQQVDLIDDHQRRSGEHVRILERLVVTLGHRENHDLGGLAQVPQRGADQVADIFDEQQCSGIMAVMCICVKIEVRKSFAHHLRVQVTPAT